jgi:glycosyltransferase involved in cell wall biosynthesis
MTVHSPLIMEQRINWRSQGPSGWLKLVLGQGSLKKLERTLLARCNSIHALSKFTRTMLDRLYAVGDRVTVIPHWRRAELQRTHTKAQARKLLGWPENVPVFFTVRHHGRRNGIDIGIRALAPLAAAGECCFMVGGDGRFRAKYEALARSLGAREAIRFLGRMSEHDLNLAYQAADLFLLPTRALECFGLIMLEAFAFGCPVLSSDAGAIPETMEPILPEFITPAGNVRVLRSKAKAFLEGRLTSPGPEALVEYTRRCFDASVIVPSLLGLLFHRSSSSGASHAASSEQGEYSIRI